MTAGRTIHILRHAHSSWAVPGQRDHQRMLDARGREDAMRLASRIERQGFANQVERLPETVDVRFSDDLYALGAAAYAAEIRAFDGPGELLLVGHNPTIEEVVFDLCTADTEALRQARPGIGTANWLTIELDAEGSSGALRGLIKP